MVRFTLRHFQLTHDGTVFIVGGLSHLSSAEALRSTLSILLLETEREAFFFSRGFRLYCRRAFAEESALWVRTGEPGPPMSEIRIVLVASKPEVVHQATLSGNEILGHITTEESRSIQASRQQRWLLVYIVC